MRKLRMVLVLVAVAVAVVVVLFFRARPIARPGAEAPASPAPSASRVPAPSRRRAVATAPTLPTSSQPSATKNPYEVIPDENGYPRYAYGWDLIRCEKEHLCPSGSVCELSPAKKVGCYASNCKSIADTSSCGPRDVCWQYTDDVFRCVPEGTAGENAECLNVSPSPDDKRCRSGLVCWSGHCRQPCRGGSCPSGQRCIAVDKSGGNACVAASSLCTSDADCGEASACIDAEGGGRKVCVQLGTLEDGSRSCRPGGCTDGQDCQGAVYGSTFYGRCRKPCDSHHSCAAGSSCAQSIDDIHQLEWVCLTSCRPMHASDCSRAEDCTNGEDGVNVCRLKMPLDVGAAEEWSGIFSEPPVAMPAL